MLLRWLRKKELGTLFRSDRCHVFFPRYFNGKKLQRKIPASLTTYLAHLLSITGCHNNIIAGLKNNKI